MIEPQAAFSWVWSLFQADQKKESGIWEQQAVFLLTSLSSSFSIFGGLGSK